MEYLTKLREIEVLSVNAGIKIYLLHHAVVEHAGDMLSPEVRWLLVAAVVIALLSVAALMRTIQIPKQYIRIYDIANLVTFLAAILMVPLGFLGLNTIPLLCVLILLQLAPIISGFWVWIKMPEKAENGTT
jgi:hypothetical protein